MKVWGMKNLDKRQVKSFSHCSFRHVVWVVRMIKGKENLLADNWKWIIITLTLCGSCQKIATMIIWHLIIGIQPLVFHYISNVLKHCNNILFGILQVCMVGVMLLLFLFKVYILCCWSFLMPAAVFMLFILLAVACILLSSLIVLCEKMCH